MKTKLELSELHAQFVDAVARGTDYAMRDAMRDTDISDIDRRCRTLVIYLSSYLAHSMPVQSAQLAKVYGRTEGGAK